MASRRKRKAWRKRDCRQTAEATAGDPLVGGPGVSLFFQNKREFHEDTLLVRQAMRESWPIPPEPRQAIPAALSDAFFRSDADMVGEYYFKTGHRLAAAELLVDMRAELQDHLIEIDLQTRHHHAG